MRLIILPGNSVKNKAWLEETKNVFSKDYETITVPYEHWNTEEKLIDFDKETRKLERLPTPITNDDVILAKSAGTALSIKAITEKKIKPKTGIFLGTPINWARGNNIPLEDWMKNLTLPTLFIQKEEDPAIGYKELNNLLEKNTKHYKSIKMKGKDHAYKELKEIKTYIDEYLETS